MPLWLILLIVIILASAAAGLFIVYVVLRLQKKPWPFFKRSITAEASEPAVEAVTISDPEIVRRQVILELERNLEIATSPVDTGLVKFQLDVWNNHYREFEECNSAILSELTQAYVDMLLANNKVWMLSEFGSIGQNSKDDYLILRTKVAERLQSILPQVKDIMGVKT
jgi:hypothetical protein